MSSQKNSKNFSKNEKRKRKMSLFSHLLWFYIILIENAYVVSQCETIKY